MSKIDIFTNTPLLVAATCFWASSLNSFIFKSSMKTLTLYDLVTLFNLKHLGEEIDPTLTIDTTLFNIVIVKSIDYGPFVKSYYHRKDEVTQAKHVAFLLT